MPGSVLLPANIQICSCECINTMSFNTRGNISQNGVSTSVCDTFWKGTKCTQQAPLYNINWHACTVYVGLMSYTLACHSTCKPWSYARQLWSNAEYNGRYIVSRCLWQWLQELGNRGTTFRRVGSIDCLVIWQLSQKPHALVYLECKAMTTT